MKVFVWIGHSKGGYPQRNLAFARFLKKNYWVDVTLGFYEYNEDCSDFEQKIVPLFFKNPKLTGFDNLLLAYRLPKNYLDEFDVVYGNIATKTKARKITRVGGDPDKTWRPSFVARVLHRFLSFFDKRIILSCDGVVSCSPDAVEYLKKIGVENICDSRNFVDTKIFYSKKVKTDKFTILFVGSNDPIKNLNGLVEACKDLDVTLRCVGGDCWIDQKKLCDKYNSSDLVVMPSFYESFGNVVLEALACGTPVLASDKVTAGRLLSRYIGICATSSKSIEQHIIFMRNNYGQVLEGTKKGMKFVRENLSKEKVLKKECEFVLKK